MMSRNGGGGRWRVEVLTSPPDFSADSLGEVGSLSDEVQGCWPEGGKEGGAQDATPTCLAARYPEPRLLGHNNALS